MKTRTELANERDAELAAELRARGYVIDADDFHVNGRNPIKFAGRVVATISRHGYGPTYELACPHFPGRGWRGDCRRTEPGEPRYWARRSYKKLSSIRDALAEACNSMPTAADIERAALRAKLDRLNDKVSEARRIYTRVDVDTLDTLLRLVTTNDEVWDSLEAAMQFTLGAMNTARSDYRELQRQAEALARQLDGDTTALDP